MPASALTPRGGSTRPEGGGVREAGLQRRSRRDADRRAGGSRPRTGRADRLCAAEDAAAADALDGFPDAGRVRPVPPRRRGLGQPPVPRRQEARRHDRRVPAAAQRRRRAAREGPPLRARRRDGAAVPRHRTPRLDAADARPAGSCGRRRPGGGRRRRRRGHHVRPRGRGERCRPARLQGRRPHDARPAEGGGAAARGRQGHRQAARGRGDERQRDRRELGEGECERDPAGLVSRRGGRHGDRRDARRREQPGRPPARHGLQGPRATAGVHRLLDGAPDLPLLRRRAALPVRPRPQLLDLRLLRAEAVEPGAAGGRAAARGGAGRRTPAHARATRSRSCT